MKKLTLFFVLACLAGSKMLSAQNVGIGTTTPSNARLELVDPSSQLITRSGANLAGISHSTPLGSSPTLSFNLYFGNAFRFLSPGYGFNMQFSPSTGNTYFTTTQAIGAVGDVAIFNNSSLVLDPNGRVGIAGASPAYPLDVNGRMRLRYNGANPGIWFNNSSNTENEFLGNYNDTILGLWNNNGGAWQFFFDHKNARLGLNISNPKVAISFSAVFGKKLSLYPGSNGDAGFDVWGNELRVHSEYSGADITFGYDTYNAAFVERMRIKGTGAVCIGTKTVATGYMLNVGGKIIAEEVRVQLENAWPDYVFDKAYKLRSLPELETYINEHKHLPNIPAAAEVEKSGVALGDMQQKMVEKIEELNLYVIDLQKQIAELKNRMDEKK